MNYYKEEQFIAKVNKEDNILDKIERWDAHKAGILHRAITITVWYKDFAVIQHRKHPVFDNVFDLTVSSHQLFENGALEKDEDTIFRTLKRELALEKNSLISKPVYKGVLYYKAKDTQAPYIEHEMCHIYSVRTSVAPDVNHDFAYGYSLQKKEEILRPNTPLQAILAPWAKEMIQMNMF